MAKQLLCLLQSPHVSGLADHVTFHPLHDFFTRGVRAMPTMKIDVSFIDSFYDVSLPNTL